MDTNLNSLSVMVNYHGKEMPCGVVFNRGNGWIFQPHYQAQRSRKVWPTPEDALRGRVSNYRLCSHEESRALMVEHSQVALAKGAA